MTVAAANEQTIEPEIFALLMRFTKRVASESQLSKAALSIWAKTNFWNAAPPEDVNKQWLPLAVHMADSGEVAELIWDKYLSPRQRKLLVEPLARVEGIKEPTGSTLALLKLIVGAHDIGKCSPMFLTQNIELYERIFKNSDDSLTKYQRAEELRGDNPHSWIGEIAFEKWLESRWNPGKAEKRYVSATAKQLGSIIGAHHGRPVSWQRHADMANPNLPGAINGDKTWKQTRRELLDWWMNWTGSQEIVDQCQGLIFPTTWQSLVAGITVMADWIASNQELFPLVDWNDLYPEGLLSAEHHRQRTKAAWEKLHLPPSWQPEILSHDPDYPWQAAAWYQKKISRKTDWSSSSPLDLENGKVSLEVVADLDLLPAERREDCIFDQVHDVPLSFDSHHRQYEWRDVVRWKCEVATDMAAAETEPSFLTTHNPGGMW